MHSAVRSWKLVSDSCPQTDLVKFSSSESMGIAVTAYSPFPQNEVVKRTPGKKFCQQKLRSGEICGSVGQLSPLVTIVTKMDSYEYGMSTCDVSGRMSTRLTIFPRA